MNGTTFSANKLGTASSWPDPVSYRSTGFESPLRRSASDGPPAHTRQGWGTTDEASVRISERLGVLAGLRPDWDGVGSLPPAREAVNTLFRALQRSITTIAAISASAHPDGYISVTVGEPGSRRFADIHRDSIEYEIEGRGDWEGPLDSSALKAFLGV